MQETDFKEIYQMRYGNKGEFLDYMPIDATVAIINYKVKKKRFFTKDIKYHIDRREQKISQVDPVEKLKSKIEDKERLVQLRKDKEKQYLNGRNWVDLSEDEKEFYQSMLDKIDFEINKFDII